MGARILENELVHLAVEVAQADNLAALQPALDLLKRAMGVEAIVYRTDGDGVPHAECGALGGATSYPAHLFDADPLMRGVETVPRGTKVLPLTNMVSRSRFRRSAAYETFYRPNESREVMALWLNNQRDREPNHAGLLIGSNKEFSSDRIQALEQLLPAFAAVAARAEAFERGRKRLRALQTVFDVRSAYPMILVDALGDILWLSKAAEVLLTQQACDAEALSAVVRPAIRMLSRRHHSSELVPLVSSRLPTKAQGFIGLEVQVMQSADGESVFLVELMPAAQSPLSPAERRVLPLLEQGLTLKEVASVLGISVETVRTHTQHIYRKRGVSSRAELLASRWL